MLHKLMVFCCAALVVGTIGTASVSASTTPPHGDMQCGLTGSMRIVAGGLPGAAQPGSATHLNAKIHNAAVSSCTNSFVTGGKAPITGGTLIMNGIGERGDNCTNLASYVASLSTTKQFVLKFTHTDLVTGQTFAVAVAKVRVDNAALSGNTITIVGGTDQTPTGNKAFGNEDVIATLNIDSTSDVDGCQAPGSTTPLTHIGFSAANGSNVYIHT